MRAKKSLGQNFLRDGKILKKIADFARIEKNDLVVEVGPGEGTLTSLLVERAEKVIAIEKDEKLAEILKEKFKKEIDGKRLGVICGDILKLQFQNVPPSQNYVLVGNIPYYITGMLFKAFLEAENQPKSITFVVQKEVADRILTRDGKESVLSISIKAYGAPEFGGKIKAGSFFPKPKVDSAIISIRNINKEKFTKATEKKFFKILKTGFAHKRKLLIKNLGTGKEVFEKCGILEKTRAENLSVENWICLAKELEQGSTEIK